MTKSKNLTLLAAVVLIGGAIIGRLSYNHQNSEKGSYMAGENKDFFKVVKVIDGDTIVIEGGEVVRYIGVDAPETGSRKNECFAREAWQKNRELVEGKMVRLEKDVSERDRYNRLLRYVWLKNGLLVNEELVKNGYAKVFTYPPDVKYSTRLLRAQKIARQKGLGLWSKCGLTKKEIKTEKKNHQEFVSEKFVPKPEDKTQKNKSKNGSENFNFKNINCSQNVYNCSDFSSQEQAQSVFDYCGGVENDIHHLDADKDGIACESLP